MCRFGSKGTGDRSFWGSLSMASIEVMLRRFDDLKSFLLGFGLTSSLPSHQCMVHLDKKGKQKHVSQTAWQKIESLTLSNFAIQDGSVICVAQHLQGEPGGHDHRIAEINVAENPTDPTIPEIIPRMIRHLTKWPGHKTRYSRVPNKDCKLNLNIDFRFSVHWSLHS